ncbi:MAG: hypothetical protein WD749_13775 [Phycisphaerales bacterium]
MPAPAGPSAANVARGRYWTRAVIRLAATVLLLYAAGRALSWAVYCTFGGGGLFEVFRLVEFWDALVPVPLAAALLLFGERLVRWVFPMPRPECPECGYRLQPATERCPECGLNLARP